MTFSDYEACSRVAVRAEPAVVRSAIAARCAALGWGFNAIRDGYATIDVPRSAHNRHPGGTMIAEVAAGERPGSTQLTLTSVFWDRPGAAETALLAGLPAVKGESIAAAGLVAAAVLLVVVVGAAHLVALGTPSAFAASSQNWSPTLLFGMCAAGSLVGGVVLGCLPKPRMLRAVVWSARLVGIASAAAWVTAATYWEAELSHACVRSASCNGSWTGIVLIVMSTAIAFTVAIGLAIGLAVGRIARHRDG